MKINSLQKKVNEQRERRSRSVRLRLLTDKSRPRLSVFRSNNYLFAQIIDDQKRATLVSASDQKLKTPKNKIERAKLVGAEIARLALKKKVSQVNFDRHWYKFHGRVKALAEAARQAGLQF